MTLADSPRVLFDRVVADLSGRYEVLAERATAAGSSAGWPADYWLDADAKLLEAIGGALQRRQDAIARRAVVHWADRWTRWLLAEESRVRHLERLARRPERAAQRREGRLELDRTPEEDQDVRISDMFPSAYISAQDVQRPTTLTIKEVKIEEVGEAREPKPICYFEEARRGLCLNRTNADAIGNITGSDETGDWRGTKVVLFVQEVEFRGKRVPAVRVRCPAGTPPRARRETVASYPAEPHPDVASGPASSDSGFGDEIPF